MKYSVLIVKIFIVVALIGGGIYFYNKRELIKRENAATELINNEKYKVAAEKLETILDSRIIKHVPERVYTKLGLAYGELSRKYSLPIKKQIQYARKALEYDPDAPVGKILRKYLKRHKKTKE